MGRRRDRQETYSSIGLRVRRAVDELGTTQARGRQDLPVKDWYAAAATHITAGSLAWIEPLTQCIVHQQDRLSLATSYSRSNRSSGECSECTRTSITRTSRSWSISAWRLISTHRSAVCSQRQTRQLPRCMHSSNSFAPLSLLHRLYLLYQRVPAG